MKNFNFTHHLPQQQIIKNWVMINAENKKVGRLCSQIVKILLGKDKIYYSPHNDCGDYVVLINADKSFFSANKFEKKEYITHSGYPGGQKISKARDFSFIQIIKEAVRGMLPKNRIGRKVFNNLFVFADESHDKKAQKPRLIDLKF